MARASDITNIIKTQDVDDTIKYVLEFNLGDKKNLELLKQLRENKSVISRTFDRRYSDREISLLNNVIDSLIMKGIRYKQDEQTESTQTSGKMCSFQDVPTVVYDSHRHAKEFILKFLNNTDTSGFTWLRLDTHYDMSIDGKLSKKVHKWDYVSHILNDESSKKISNIHRYSVNWRDNRDIVDMYWRHRNLIKETLRGDLPSVCGNYSYLPKIDGPTIIDVDLDFLERCDGGHKNGGIFHFDFDTSTKLENINLSLVLQDNQTKLRMHPRYAAHLLREQVSSPVMLLVSTERSYRNRLFHHMVEYDFLDGLIH